LIITSSCGIEPGKNIPYPPIVDEALKFCTKVKNEIPRLIKQRTELDGKLVWLDSNPELYHDYDKLMSEET